MSLTTCVSYNCTLLKTCGAHNKLLNDYLVLLGSVTKYFSS